MFFLFPDWLIIWLAVAGVSAFILGARSAALLLLVPAIIRYAITPLLPDVPPGLMQAVMVVAVPVASVFGSIRLLQGAVTAVYGRQAGGYVAGNYLVRTFDFLGRAVVALLVLAAFVVWAWNIL